jgi:ABC-2 type transport system permease protein
MLSSGAAVRLVAGREIRTRTRSKAFRITTVVMLLVVLAFLAIMRSSPMMTPAARSA